MALEVSVTDSIENVNSNQWNNVVEQSTLACVYHRYEWLSAIEAGLPHEPRHFVVTKKNNPVAVFPNFVTPLGRVKRLSSIRPGFGGPVVTTDEERAVTLLLDAAADSCRGTVLFSELRPYDQGYVRYHELLTGRGYSPAILSTRFRLELTRGLNDIFAEMDGERRRGIRRGHDREFEIVDERVDERTLAAFYDDYATVQARVDQPTLPRSFFLALDRFEDRVKVFSLHADGDRRGMFLYLLDDEQSTLQHVFTAVTEAHFAYRTPELLHEHAIRWGIENGYETYELRGSPSDFRNGVFRFKELFGAQPVPQLVYERGRPASALFLLNAGRSLARRIRYWANAIPEPIRAPVLDRDGVLTRQIR